MYGVDDIVQYWNEGFCGVTLVVLVTLGHFLIHVISHGFLFYRKIHLPLPNLDAQSYWVGMQ